MLAGTRTREQALHRYGAFSDAHAWKFRSLLFTQRAVGRLTPSRAVTALARSLENPRVCDWAFEHYVRIAPASFVGQATFRSRGRVVSTAASASRLASTALAQETSASSPDAATMSPAR